MKNYKNKIQELLREYPSPYQLSYIAKEMNEVAGITEKQTAYLCFLWQYCADLGDSIQEVRISERGIFFQIDDGTAYFVTKNGNVEYLYWGESMGRFSIPALVSRKPDNNIWKLYI